MKHPHHDNEVQHLREQLRLRIDTAMKSVAEVLQVAADFFIATRHPKGNGIEVSGKVETSPVSEMLTRQQAAEYLGIKASTLAGWRTTGRYSLPFVKMGHKTLYRKADLDRFLERRFENPGREDVSR